MPISENVRKKTEEHSRNNDRQGLYNYLKPMLENEPAKFIKYCNEIITKTFPFRWPELNKQNVQKVEELCNFVIENPESIFNVNREEITLSLLKEFNFITFYYNHDPNMKSIIERIKQKAYFIVARCYRKLDDLQKAMLAYYEITDKHLCFYDEVVKSRVKIFGNQIERLAKNDVQLKELELNNHFVDNKEDLNLLIDALETNTNLKSLRLHGRWMSGGRSVIDDQSVILLARNAHVESLDVSDNDITDSVVSALVKNPYIRHLNLNDCNVSMLCMCEFLKSNTLFGLHIREDLYISNKDIAKSISNERLFKILETAEIKPKKIILEKALCGDKKAIVAIYEHLNARYNRGINIEKCINDNSLNVCEVKATLLDQAEDILWKKIKSNNKDNKARVDAKYAEELRIDREKKQLENDVMRAIKEGDTNRLSTLIHKLPDGVDTYLEYGGHLIQYSINIDCPTVTSFLLDHGAKLEVHDREKTPLFNVAEKGLYDFVKLFLRRGSNITGEFFFNDETAFSIAAFKMNGELISILKKRDHYVLKYMPIKNNQIFSADYKAVEKAAGQLILVFIDVDENDEEKIRLGYSHPDGYKESVLEDEEQETFIFNIIGDIWHPHMRKHVEREHTGDISRILASFGGNILRNIAIEGLNQHLQKKARDHINVWKEHYRQGNSTSLWIRFGKEEKLLYEYSIKALTLAHNLSKIPGIEIYDEMPELLNYVKIYKLIYDKIAIIKQTAPLNLQNYFNEIGQEKCYRLRPIIEPRPVGVTLDYKQLLSKLEQLNQELKELKEFDIEWSKYPKLYVAQYRCVHYYSHYFDENQRREHMFTSHLGRMAPAHAVYLMSSLSPIDSQIARESELLENGDYLRILFATFFQTGPVFDSTGRRYLSLGHQLQERMSNEYDGYKNDIKSCVNAAYEILSDLQANGYPHYATSDLPDHALRYGYGLKPIKGLSEHLLKPEYDIKGMPKNPVLGKIFICLFTPFEMAKEQIRHVLGMHDREQLTLRDPVAFERETSATGGLDSGYIFYEECVEVPDFSIWDETYRAEFGMDQRCCNNYKNKLASSKTSRERTGIEKNVIEYVKAHKEKVLLRIAQEEAKARGGYLIYKTSDRNYALEPEPIRNSTRPPYVPKREKELLDKIGKERFTRKKAKTEYARGSKRRADSLGRRDVQEQSHANKRNKQSQIQQFFHGKKQPHTEESVFSTLATNVTDANEQAAHNTKRHGFH